MNPDSPVRPSKRRETAPKRERAAFKRLLYQAFGLRLDGDRFVKE